MEAKAQNAVKAKERQAIQKTKAIEEEQKRHKTNLEALEKEYKEADEREQGIVDEITKELEKIAESYEASLRKINKYLATNAPMLEEEELKQQLQQKQQQQQKEDEEKKEGMMAKMMNLDMIKEHLKTDGNLAGKEVTPDIIAASIVSLLQKLLAPSGEARASTSMEIDQATTRDSAEQPQQQQPQQQSGEEKEAAEPPAKKQIVTDGNRS